jgi:hypothetical protein
MLLAYDYFPIDTYLRYEDYNNSFCSSMCVFAVDNTILIIIGISSLLTYSSHCLISTVVLLFNLKGTIANLN